ncbi:MAG TPA: OmpA family protein [Steroidobacteraceae bacterium]|nr:OmpA family protein [Steroidobacteraceae bacterium]
MQFAVAIRWSLAVKKFSVFSLGCLIAAMNTGALAADASSSQGGDAGSWYFSPMLQYHLKDNDPQLKDDFAYQAGFGINLAHEWALEADFNRGRFDIHGTDAMRRQTGYSIDVIKKFFPEDIMQRWMIQPYALAGGGELDDQTSAPGFNDRAFHTYLAEAGIGLLTGIGNQQGPTRVQLRTEAKYRLEFANAARFGVKDPSGIIFGVGLQMNFGNRDERPPVIRETVRQVTVTAPAPPPPPAPAPPPPPPAPKGEIRLQGVTFATNSAELIPESDTALDIQVRQFQQYPDLVIEVRGYTDNRGSAEYNLKLSQRRAEAVMSYLQTHGVGNRITAKGYGKADPIADNATKEGQLANRRVTLNVSGGP